MGTTVEKKRTTKRRKKYKIPFNSDGNMLHYADSSGRGYWDGGKYKAVIWEEPVEFEDTIQFVNFEKGSRSGAWAWYESVLTGKRYCVTLGEMLPFIEHSMVAGVVNGVFGYSKRGQNYTLTYVRSLFEVEKVNIVSSVEVCDGK